jgi:murein L,D-transpeptidase YcbB/YkuD
MGQRLIISESEKNSILNMHTSAKKGISLNEGIEGYEHNMSIQCFLIKKGMTDDKNQKIVKDGSIGRLPNSKSAQAIAKYQDKIGVTPDGVWGEETMKKMPSGDKVIFKQCVSDEGDLFDKFVHWIGMD